MNKETFIRYLNSPWRMQLYFLTKLPAAWFMGLRVGHCDESKAVVRLPYGWRSKNPFRSIYFVAQCAAGELSTGLLALIALREKPPVSMLVLHVEAQFTKKASEELRFTCEQGKAVQNTIQQALATGKPQTIRMESVGLLPDGTEAGRVWITWSFKAKQQTV